MEKIKLNYITDLFAAAAFAVTAITGLIIFFFLPGGIRQGGKQTFAEITKSNWATIHEWVGIFMILIVIIHLLLHWKWIVSTTGQFLGGKSD